MGIMMMIMTFQTSADQFARFAAQNLGYPIVDVELQDINFYNALERATTVMVTKYLHLRLEIINYQ